MQTCCKEMQMITRMQINATGIIVKCLPREFISTGNSQQILDFKVKYADNKVLIQNADVGAWERISEAATDQTCTGCKFKSLTVDAWGLKSILHGAAWHRNQVPHSCCCCLDPPSLTYQQPLSLFVSAVVLRLPEIQWRCSFFFLISWKRRQISEPPPIAQPADVFKWKRVC